MLLLGYPACKSHRILFQQRNAMSRFVLDLVFCKGKSNVITDNKFFLLFLHFPYVQGWYISFWIEQINHLYYDRQFLMKYKFNLYHSSGWLNIDINIFQYLNFKITVYYLPTTCESQSNLNSWKQTWAVSDNDDVDGSIDVQRRLLLEKIMVTLKL